MTMDPLQLVAVKLGEPSFLRKNNAQFDIPPELLDERYRDAAKDLEADLDGEVEKIPVQNIALPKLENAEKLSKTESFSIFSPIHKQYVNELVKLFLDAKDKEELLSLAIYTRDHVNSQLFFYAYSIALSHRDDTQDIEMPSLLESDAGKFISNTVLYDARQEAFVVPPSLRRPIEIPVQFTASDVNPEQRLAYFREDIGVNFHHFHWHIVFPDSGPVERLFRKDRRGELFFYMHSQMLARYNLERFCNKLKAVKPLALTSCPIKNGYFPKLTAASASRTVIGRQDNAIPQDLSRRGSIIPIKLSDMQTWADRLRDGILKGFLISASGESIPINNERGVDILGNTVEASSLSVNKQYYGDLHNSGHLIIALVHDAENEYMEQSGVMGATHTAMRDPAFFEWHTYVDSLYKLHKTMLPPYTRDDLRFDGVSIRSFEILDENDQPTTTLETFWQTSEVNLSAGLDYVASGAIRVKFKHLNHKNFTYKISISSDRSLRGTVRIFLLPVRNPAYQSYDMDEARLHAVELDRFPIDFVRGINNVHRRSTQSAVTIPFESIFPPVVVNQDGVDVSFNRRSLREVHCRCGWPQYLLIPKGTAYGYKCQIFVMVSDFEKDQVHTDANTNCKISSVYCGLRNSVYPDKRPMGYPFDRRILAGSWRNFLTHNMVVVDVTIRNENEIKKEYKAELVSVATNDGVRDGI